tara:strand:+ start:509 stop:649 length:141 start_codon:yes stop_codon:yes gene_type:complete
MPHNIAYLGFKSFFRIFLETFRARGPETLIIPIPLCPNAEARAQIV